MEFSVDSEGNPLSRFVSSLGGRQLNLMAGGAESHPLQFLLPKAKAVALSLRRLFDELDRLPMVLEPPFDGGATTEAFRRLAYDATELFDVFAQLIPSRLDTISKTGRQAVNEYKKVVSRLRAPWALICNKCKHNGSQIAFSGGISQFNGQISLGYMILSPKDGRAMLIDEEVHKSPERRASFIKMVHELVHGILRADMNASKLVNVISDNHDASIIPQREFSYPFTNEIDRLLARPTILVNEGFNFNAVSRDDDKIRLIKDRGIIYPGEFRFLVQVEGDGHSDVYSFA